MISNRSLDGLTLLEVTNEVPVNRLGGVGSAIAGLMSGFRARGVPVLWYLIDHHYRPDEIDRILEEVPDVAVGSLDELGAIRAPIAHLHTYNHDPRILESLRGKKIVFTVHSLMRCEAESNEVDLKWAIERQEHFVSRCDEVVLVSEAELRHYRRLGYVGLNPRVSVIHNGLAPTGPPRRAASSRKLGFCGRMVPRKRPEYVQWILKEDGFEEYESLIAGRGFSAYARDLVEDPELRHRVRFLGWCGRERLEAFYAQVALLAIPSTYEPFGMVALEAISRGVPVACTRIDGLVEVLGADAVYAEDGSYASFHRAMRRWLEMGSAELEAMTARAYRRFTERFTDAMAADRYLALFECVGGPRA